MDSCQLKLNCDVGNVTHESYCVAHQLNAACSTSLRCFWVLLCKTRFWDAVKDLTGLKVPAVHPLTWTGDVLSGQARWCGLASVRSLVRKIKIAAGRGWAGNTERALLLLEIHEPTIIRPCLVSKKNFMISITSNLQTYAWSIKRSWKNNSYTI